MKRALLFAALIAVLFVAVPGCATLYVDAPAGREVKLLARDTPPSTLMVTKTWYLFWGLVPISPNHTAGRVAELNLDAVKVKTYTGVVDVLLTAITGGIVWPRTVVIEGRRN